MNPWLWSLSDGLKQFCLQFMQIVIQLRLETCEDCIVSIGVVYQGVRWNSVCGWGILACATTQKYIVLAVMDVRWCAGAAVYAERFSCWISKSTVLNASIYRECELVIISTFKCNQLCLMSLALSFVHHLQNNFLWSTPSSGTGSILEVIELMWVTQEGEETAYILQASMSERVWIYRCTLPPSWFLFQ